FLLTKLKSLPLEIENRRTLANAYFENINNPKITLPTNQSIFDDSWHLFVVQVEDRDRFRAYLADNGIGTDVHYPIPPHKQKAMADYNKLNLPITEKIHDSVVSLPLNRTITTKQIIQIASVINRY
ncbi:MAG: DegT/DnrJ/EryC1/StrS family aminotransferase, partial [Leadbetterella sp.]